MAHIVHIDDHSIFREGIASLIDKSEQDHLVASLADAPQLSRILSEHQVDILVLDLALENGMTFDLISQTKTSHPELKVIVLSMHSDQAHVEKAMQAGADGYALKRDAFDDLIFAIRAAERGGRFLSPTIISGDHQVSISLEKPDLAKMPERQRQILQHLARGKANKQIAAELGIALPTVKNHLSVLFRKYGVDNRVELLAKLNLIDMD